jgi:hypothetical protein
LFTICSIVSDPVSPVKQPENGKDSSVSVRFNKHRQNICTAQDRWNHPQIIAFSTIGPECRPYRSSQKEQTPPIMLTPEFLRRQAENCLRIARSCFDLASAERLRLMATELTAKAAEIEQSNQESRRSRSMERNH